MTPDSAAPPPPAAGPDRPANPATPLHPPAGPDAHIIVLIGPEGGWTDTERAAASKADWLPWCFADNVLRIEQAAAAAAAILRHAEREHASPRR